jgi:hypothetical protein
MKRLSAFCALIILLFSVTSVAQQSDAADKRGGSWFNNVRATFLERLSGLEKGDLDRWESAATKSTSVPGVRRADLGLLMPKFNPLWDSKNKLVSGAVSKYANRLEQVPATAVEQWRILTGASQLVATVSLIAENELFPQERFSEKAFQVFAAKFR